MQEAHVEQALFVNMGNGFCSCIGIALVDQVTPYGDNDLGQHYLRQWLGVVMT